MVDGNSIDDNDEACLTGLGRKLIKFVQTGSRTQKKKKKKEEEKKNSNKLRTVVKRKGSKKIKASFQFFRNEGR